LNDVEIAANNNPLQENLIESQQFNPVIFEKTLEKFHSFIDSEALIEENRVIDESKELHSRPKILFKKHNNSYLLKDISMDNGTKVESKEPKLDFN